eukprot:6417704-Amphidinium_carterae.1
MAANYAPDQQDSEPNITHGKACFIIIADKLRVSLADPPNFEKCNCAWHKISIHSSRQMTTASSSPMRNEICCVGPPTSYIASAASHDPYV